MITAALAIFWTALGIATRDHAYLLWTAAVICAEMGYHYRCYRVLAQRAVSKIRKVK